MIRTASDSERPGAQINMIRTASDSERLGTPNNCHTTQATGVFKNGCTFSKT